LWSGNGSIIWKWGGEIMEGGGDNKMGGKIKEAIGKTASF
jgi:hypothetical protein